MGKGETKTKAAKERKREEKEDEGPPWGRGTHDRGRTKTTTKRSCGQARGTSRRGNIKKHPSPNERGRKGKTDMRRR